MKFTSGNRHHLISNFLRQGRCFAVSALHFSGRRRKAFMIVVEPDLKSSFGRNLGLNIIPGQAMLWRTVEPVSNHENNDHAHVGSRGLPGSPGG
jgi:hypothetical protein